jgi:AraC family transcriptional regulator, activator of mtrCDE
MSSPTDWLSRLLDMMPVRGQLDIRCLYAAPWRLTIDRSEPGEIPFHVIVEGAAVLEDPETGVAQFLTAGDILLFPHGIPHTLHDDSGAPPEPAQERPGMNLIISENAGTDSRLDMLCGRFVITPPYDRILHGYLPPRLIVHTACDEVSATHPATSAQLAGLVGLMRTEAIHQSLGGRAMLSALSAAMFALTLRLATESDAAPIGLLALASQPHLTPALAALFRDPAHPWTLPELAPLCNMSRATFARQFQQTMGASANDLLTDIRMSLAVNELRNSALSTAEIAEAVGYQSDAAFQRAFKQRIGMTPARWRRTARLPNECSRS